MDPYLRFLLRASLISLVLAALLPLGPPSTASAMPIPSLIDTQTYSFSGVDTLNTATGSKTTTLSLDLPFINSLIPEVGALVQLSISGTLNTLHSGEVTGGSVRQGTTLATHDVLFTFDVSRYGAEDPAEFVSRLIIPCAFENCGNGLRWNLTAPIRQTQEFSTPLSGPANREIVGGPISYTIDSTVFGPVSSNVTLQYSVDVAITTKYATLSDVIRDSITIQSGGPTLTATFVPNFDLTLSDVAMLGGFEHFNWLNVITQDQEFAPLRCTTNPGLLDRNGDCSALPAIDPPRGGYIYQVEMCADPFESGGYGHSPLQCVFPIQDNLDWYLDEVFSRDLLRNTGTSERVAAQNRRDLRSATSLEFSDSPSAVLPEVIKFRTSLVGVRADGTGAVIDGTRFEWEAQLAGALLTRSPQPKSTTIPGFGNTFVTFDGFLPRGAFTPDELALFATNGIEIVNSVDGSVSQPSSIILYTGGLLILCIVAWKQRLQQRGGSQLKRTTEVFGDVDRWNPPCLSRGQRGGPRARDLPKQLGGSNPTRTI